MIKVIFLLMIVSLSSYAEEETIVFVGKQLAYESKTFEDQQKLICPEPEGDEVCVTMDSLFAAQYKIEDLVKGKLKNKVIDIYQFDHYGIPEYFKYKYALIVADVTEMGILGHKYTSIPVYKSRSGKFYYCPEPKESFIFEEYAKKVDFEPKVTIDVTHLSEQGIKNIESSVFYKKEKGILNCVKGVPLKHVAEYLLEN